MDGYEEFAQAQSDADESRATDPVEPVSDTGQDEGEPKPDTEPGTDSPPVPAEAEPRTQADEQDSAEAAAVAEAEAAAKEDGEAHGREPADPDGAEPGDTTDGPAPTADAEADQAAVLAAEHAADDSGEALIRADSADAAQADPDNIVCGDDAGITEPLTEREQEIFNDYRDQLTAEEKTRPVTEPGASYDYQREHCGEVEYRITPDGDLPKAAWADGLNEDLGLAQDAKFVDEDSASSWYIPDTLSPAMAGLAERRMDDRLIKYRDAITSPDNPIRGLEVIVNNHDAAAFISTRMDALGVPGIVRVRQ